VIDTTWVGLVLLDVVYTIAFSLMLLHTDAHNKNVRHKMSKDQYVRQAKSIDGVNTIPTDILEVRSPPWHADHSVIVMHITIISGLLTPSPLPYKIGTL
jgi:hypothetical protein